MARTTKKTVASRGFVNDIILESLLNGDKYGYEIIKEVEQKSNGKIVLKQPSLYSSLRRFETKGYISSYWGDSNIGGRRHYYSLTETGKQYFYEKNKSDDDEEELKDVEENVEEIPVSPAPKKVKPEETYEIDETQEYDEIPVVTDSYLSQFKGFEFSDKVDELLGESIEPPAAQPGEEKQPHNLYNRIHKKEEDLEYIKEREEDKKESPVEEAPQLEEEKFYFKNGNIVEQVALDEEKTNTATSFIQQGLFDKKQEYVVKEVPATPKQQAWEDLRKEALLKQSSTSFDKQAPTLQERENASQHVTEEPQIDVDKAAHYKQSDFFDAPVRKKVNVFVDENGITRIADDETLLRKPEKRIFDNIGARIDSSSKDVIAKRTAFTESKNELKTPFASEETTEEKEDLKAINYKEILGSLYAIEDNKDRKPVEKIIPNKEEWLIDKGEAEEYSPAPAAQFNTGTTTKEVLVKHYQPSVKQKEYDFVLVNKVKALLGVILFTFILLQVSTLLIVLNAKDLIGKSDQIYYILAYCVSFAVLLGLGVPWLIAPTRRTLQKYNLNFALILGSLAFLTISVFTYAINSFTGLTINNVSNYLTSLLLPIILAANFVIAPIIYRVIIANKNMY